MIAEGTCLETPAFAILKLAPIEPKKLSSERKAVPTIVGGTYKKDQMLPNILGDPIHCATFPDMLLLNSTAMYGGPDNLDTNKDANVTPFTDCSYESAVEGPTGLSLEEIHIPTGGGGNAEKPCNEMGLETVKKSKVQGADAASRMGGRGIRYCLVITAICRREVEGTSRRATVVPLFTVCQQGVLCTIVLYAFTGLNVGELNNTFTQMVTSKELSERACDRLSHNGSKASFHEHCYNAQQKHKSGRGDLTRYVNQECPTEKPWGDEKTSATDLYITGELMCTAANGPFYVLGQMTTEKKQHTVKYHDMHCKVTPSEFWGYMNTPGVTSTMLAYEEVDAGAAPTDSGGHSNTRGYGLTGAVMASANEQTTFAYELHMDTRSDVLLGSTKVYAKAEVGWVAEAITINAFRPPHWIGAIAFADGPGYAVSDTVPGGSPPVSADVDVPGTCPVLDNTWITTDMGTNTSYLANVQEAAVYLESDTYSADPAEPHGKVDWFEVITKNVAAPGNH